MYNLYGRDQEGRENYGTIGIWNIGFARIEQAGSIFYSLWYHVYGLCDCKRYEVIFSDQVQGKDITKLFYYKSAPKKVFAEMLLPVAMKKHRAIEPSMLQDLRHGKPCEIDAINGVVCKWGRKCGVPTPINDRIVEIIKRAQAGKQSLVPGNTCLFNDLL